MIATSVSKQIRSRLGCAIVSGALLLGAPQVVTAAGSDVLNQANQLCAANHAQAPKVLADAGAAGWTDPFADPSDPFQAFFAGIAGTVRLKTNGSHDLWLKLATQSQDSTDGRLISVHCLISVNGSDSGDLKAAITRQFREPPAVSQPRAMQWLYVEEGAKRRFLAQSQGKAELKAGRVLVVVSAILEDASAAVDYREIRLEQRR